MTRPSSRTQEDYIKHRYERWRNMAVPFDYKQTKSDRMAQILDETGGLTGIALELGVGPGGIARPLSRRGMRIVGVDLSWDGLRRAQDYCKGDRVELLQGSGFALPFQDASLPLVYASQVFHLFESEDRLHLMREVRRVLSPGGRFVFDMKNVVTHPVRYWTSSVPTRKRNFPPTAEISSLLDRAGFSDVETHPGVLPGVGAVRVPNSCVFRALAHTVFFIARPA